MKSYDEITKRVLERRDEYQERKRVKRQNIAQISAVVVCIVAITIAGFAIVRRNWLKTQILELVSFQTETSDTENLLSDDETSYVSKDKNTTSHKKGNIKTTDNSHKTTETTVKEMTWNDKSMPGKFRTLGINNSQQLNAIDESDAGGSLKKYVYPFGADKEIATSRRASLLITDMPVESRESNGTAHTALVDIFSLEGLSEELALGVRFKDDSKIYTYVSASYVPQTLGDFLEAVDYDNTVSYGNIHLPTGAFTVTSANKADIKRYLLSDKSAVNIMDADAETTGRRVTVSVSCSELGRYYKTLIICEDGHIITNLIGYEYTFYVGKEAVAEFLKNSYNFTFEKETQVTENTESPVEETTTAIPTTEPDTEVCTQSVPVNEEEGSDTTTSQADTQAFAESDTDIAVVEAKAETEIEITTETTEILQ